MSTGKSGNVPPGRAKTPEEQEAERNALVIDRVNRARGDYLARTGQDVKWIDIGRRLGWNSPTTASDVKLGKRALRVDEIREIAELLGASPGWIAFGEGGGEASGGDGGGHGAGLDGPQLRPIQPPGQETHPDALEVLSAKIGKREAHARSVAKASNASPARRGSRRA